LVHAAARLRILGRQVVACERVIHIANDCRRFVDRELAVPQDRHPLERVQREVARRVHLGFEVMKGVRHLLMGQDDAGHLHVNAARKTEQGDIGHGGLQAGISLGSAWERDIPPQSLGRRTGDVQRLGECLGKSRATAMGPDNGQIGVSVVQFNGSSKTFQNLPAVCWR